MLRAGTKKPPAIHRMRPRPPPPRHRATESRRSTPRDCLPNFERHP
jgi:hypothetical protein